MGLNPDDFVPSDRTLRTSSSVHQQMASLRDTGMSVQGCCTRTRAHTYTHTHAHPSTRTDAKMDPQILPTASSASPHLQSRILTLTSLTISTWAPSPADHLLQSQPACQLCPQRPRGEDRKSPLHPQKTSAATLFSFLLYH